MDKSGLLIEHTFRHEYGRLVALLSRSIGAQQIDLVEDAVQAALMKGIQTWGRRGLPQDPSGWLYRTAKNLVIDTIRRKRIETRAIEKSRLTASESTEEELESLFQSEQGDETLRFLFLTCHPSIPLESQVALALRTVGGFSVEEIAGALLISRANAEKRITRAKEKLREFGEELIHWDRNAMAPRGPSVQATIYLIFSEGYLSTSANSVLRRDLCEEAIRLVRLLIDQFPYDRGSSEALLALMLMHSARFNARLDTSDCIVLLESQDRNLWNWERIREAMHCMAGSTSSINLSRYHVEAAIAWEHCRVDSFAKVDWDRVTGYYETLLKIHPSPMVQLNFAIATLYGRGPESALPLLVGIDGKNKARVRPWWDCAIAEVYRQMGKKREAIAHLIDAFALSHHPAQRELITRKMESLEID